MLACTDDFSPKVSSSKVALGSMTDPRDGQTYKTVKIGKQTWMAQNLNYKTENRKCLDHDPTKCDEYGGIYPWADAMKACPAGWHLSTERIGISWLMRLVIQRLRLGRSNPRKGGLIIKISMEADLMNMVSRHSLLEIGFLRGITHGRRKVSLALLVMARAFGLLKSTTPIALMS